MANTALRVEGLGKRYRLGGLQTYQTLRDSVVDLLRGRQGSQKKKPEFWALRDVSFELKEGEVLGIVGRNGAGKSTLLKLLSRITTPDTGRIEVHGRVGSLLEIGTGFHPELSGRENVFMNGILLGMKRREVERKFDEIVAFSGVEEFLDTPVKRYSSGMRVRLGFAVAAHLDPEILVVDEVLAVGDAEFQRKCLGRMNAVASEGRTVLFVSHQMEAVQSLCSRAIWLNGGKMCMDGRASEVVSSYLSALVGTEYDGSVGTRTDRTGAGTITVANLSFADGNGHPIMTGQAARFEVALRLHESLPQDCSLMIRIVIRDHMDRILALLSNELTGQTLMLRDRTIFQCRMDKIPLVPGQYLVDVSVWSNGVLEDKVFRAASFDVLPGDFHGGGKTVHIGSIHLGQSWEVAL